MEYDQRASEKYERVFIFLKPMWKQAISIYHS